jgi:hypothetical protein
VSGNGQEFDAELVHPRGNLADRLGGVGMEGNAMLRERVMMPPSLIAWCVAAVS